MTNEALGEVTQPGEAAPTIMHPEHLGRVEPWQIKAFPKTLREDFTKVAREREITVAELLTEIVISWRDKSGRFSEAHEAAFTNIRAGQPLNLDRLDRLVTMATTTAAHSETLPVGVRALMFSLIKRELRGMKTPPRRTRETIEAEPPRT